MYDVIVVGAGPSGSTAATFLAQRGLKTLLLDREDFPRAKACGDAVQPFSFVIMREMGITGAWPQNFFDIEKVGIISPSGIKAVVKATETQGERARMVTRHEFDNILLNHAVQCGAEFHKALVTGPILENDCVVGVRAEVGQTAKEYRAKLTIGADGATSAIARGLHAASHCDKETAVSLRGYIEVNGDLDHTIEFAFLRAILPGYGWLFPMGDNCANIGVGIRADVYKKNKIQLEQYLEIYLRTPSIQAVLRNNHVNEIKSWQLPLWTDRRQRVFNGAILVGDAGSFVSPLTGAGIANGMKTAKIAADVGVDAIHSGDVSASNLAQYDIRWRDQLQGIMRLAVMAQRLLTRMPVSVDAITLLGQIAPNIVEKLFAKI